MKDIPEDELLVHAKAGNEYAKDALTELHSRHNQRIQCAAYKYGGGEREDAMQAGSLALLEAVHKYEPMGHQFGTYAQPWLNKMAGRERVQANVCGMTGRESELDKHQGREIPTETDTSDSSSDPMDFVTSTNSTCTAEVEYQYIASVDYLKMRAAVQAIQMTVNDVQQEIINCRILKDEPETHADIAKRFGLTPQAVSQQEKRLREKLQSALVEYRDYLDR